MPLGPAKYGCQLDILEQGDTRLLVTDHPVQVLLVLFIVDYSHIQHKRRQCCPWDNCIPLRWVDCISSWWFRCKNSTDTSISHWFSILIPYCRFGWWLIICLASVNPVAYCFVRNLSFLNFTAIMVVPLLLGGLLILVWLLLVISRQLGTYVSYPILRLLSMHLKPTCFVATDAKLSGLPCRVRGWITDPRQVLQVFRAIQSASMSHRWAFSTIPSVLQRHIRS